MAVASKASLPTLPWYFSLALVIGLPLTLILVVRHDPTAPPRWPTPTHPLDPLTPSEIQTAIRILRDAKHLPEHIRFPNIALAEPDKKVVLNFSSGPVPRSVFVVVYDYQTNTTHEAVVDLNEKRVTRYDLQPNVQPMMFVEEYTRLPEIVRQDSRVAQGLARRGINDPATVQVDLWAAGDGPIPPDVAPGTRLCRATFYSLGESKLGYFHPIEGLTALLNLNTRKVIEVTDRERAAISTVKWDFGNSENTPLSNSTASALPGSFTVQNQEIHWENWRFRFLNHQRDGLVLYQVRFIEGERERSILYRGGIAEMVVPYADPEQGWSWRAAFDQGEYGLGLTSGTLEAGIDVPANAKLFSTVMANEHGDVVIMPNNVAVYERDMGLLWKHRSWDPDLNMVKRARELVVTQTATVGNYDYLISWVFCLDGQIRVELGLSGILLAKGVASPSCEGCAQLEKDPGKVVISNGDDRFGTLVAPNIVAPNHQHFFSFRLDFDIDGQQNSIVEKNVRADSAAANAFLLEETVLTTEQKAQRDLNLDTHRRWKVYNPDPKTRTALGHQPGYTLESGENSKIYLTPASATRKRAGFVDHHLWVTRYQPNEMYASGRYPNQAKESGGLSSYANNNQSLVNQDLVVWYTLGVTHIARPEEWPIMPMARSGFRLLPDGFFTQNPTILNSH